MTISPETHMLVADIAHRMSQECKSSYEAEETDRNTVIVKGDLASYFAHGWLLNEGFRQSFLGIGKSLDEVEQSLNQANGRERRRTMAKVVAAQK